MSFGFFTWWLLLVPAAVVALYFLRLRRQERVVSSTFLWSRTLEDLHVNAPFQRLRKSLLLLLQLLILAALILGAFKPMFDTTRSTGITRVLLIDRSASMNTVEDGDTRLEMARDRATELLGAMEEGDVSAVVAFADRPILVQSLHADPAQLRSAVNSIEPSSLPTDFVTALRTAASLLGEGADGEVYVFSDGAFTGLSQVASELELVNVKYVSVGSTRDNLGIVELDVARNYTREKATEIFSAVHNSGEVEQTVTLSVYRDDDLIDAAQLTVSAGGTKAHVFDGEGHDGETLRLELDRGGALPDDDRAWLRLEMPEPIAVLLVGEKNYFLELAMRVNPQITARRVSLAAFESLLAENKLEDDEAEVIVFDRECPDRPVEKPALYIGCWPDYPTSRPVAADGGEDTSSEAPGEDGSEEGGEDGSGEVAEGQGEGTGDAIDDAGDAGPAADGEGTKDTVELPDIVDWDRSHPVNRYITYADLIISSSRRLPEAEGSRSILESGEGSLATAVTFAPTGKPAVSHLVLGFDLLQTNWAWLPSFPKFFLNTMAWLGESSRDTSAARYRSGEALVYYAPKEAVEALHIVDPEGVASELVAAETGEVSYTETDSVGVYKLQHDDMVLREFPVSLLSRDESAIAPAPTLQIGADRVAEPEEVPADRDLWKALVLIALGICLFEWWIYNRRLTL